MFLYFGFLNKAVPFPPLGRQRRDGLIGGCIQSPRLLSEDFQEDTFLPFLCVLSVESGFYEGVRGIFLLEGVPMLRVAASLGNLEASH